MRSGKPEEYCSRTVVFPAMFCGIDDVDGGGSTWTALLLSSYIVPLPTGSTSHHVLGLWV